MEKEEGDHEIYLKYNPFLLNGSSNTKALLKFRMEMQMERLESKRGWKE